MPPSRLISIGAATLLIERVVLAAPLGGSVEAAGDLAPAAQVRFGPDLVPIGIVLITGLFLLFAGRRVLRPGLAIVGSIAGGLAGNAIGHAMQSVTVLPPVVWSIAGLLIGLVLASILWRLFVAGVLATVAAGLGTLAVLTAVQLGVIGFTDQDAGSTTDEAVVGSDDAAASETTEELLERAAQEARDAARAIAADLAAERLGLDGDSADDEQAEQSTPTGRTVRAMLEAVETWLDRLNDRLANDVAHVRERFDALDPPLRTALLTVAVLGAFFGFLLGLAAERWSTTLATALLGSGLLLLATTPLVGVISPAGAEVLAGLPPGAWLLGWVVLSTVGTLLQARRRDRDTADGEA